MNECWHDKENIAASMNSALPGYLSVLNKTPHVAVLRKLIDGLTAKAGTGLKILDIGCGTGLTSLFCKDHVYVGCDLPHIIEGCAKLNYPGHTYFYMDLLTCTDFSFIKDYDVIILNAVLDVMELPLPLLSDILAQSKRYVLIHRQEITEKGNTHSFTNPSYSGETWHSIINRTDFDALVKKHLFKIMETETDGFENWENGGSSFLLEKGNSWALHKNDHSLFSKFFAGKKNGFFIEAGANDGLRQSNTMFFEHYLDWRGLLIEPVQEQADQCRKNRSPNTIVECAALVPPNYGHDKCIIEYTPECYGLMSVMKGMKNTTARLKKAGETGTGVWAPARTLNELLEKHKANIPDVIDLLVLDIEGYESEALKGIDFDKWNIRVLLIEELDHDDLTIMHQLDKWYHRSERLGENDIVYLRK